MAVLIQYILFLGLNAGYPNVIFCNKHNKTLSVDSSTLILESPKNNLTAANSCGERIQSLQKKVKIYSITLAFLCTLTMAGAIFSLMRIRKMKKKEDALVKRQMNDYDEYVLQKLILTTKYEKIKETLKRDFGLDDNYFSDDDLDTDF